MAKGYRIYLLDQDFLRADAVLNPRLVITLFRTVAITLPFLRPITGGGTGER